MTQILSFSWPEYLSCFLSLAAIVSMGIYFSLNGATNTVQEHLFRNKKSSLLLITASLVASCFNYMEIIKVVYAAYFFGIESICIILGVALTVAIVNYNFLSVVYSLGATSLYEYLELRFNKKVRALGAILFILATIAWLPVVLFLPDLIFNQVTDYEVTLFAPLIWTVCTFCTVMGGLKSNLWISLSQLLLTFLTLSFVAIKGFLKFDLVFEKVLTSQITIKNLSLNWRFWVSTLIESFYYLHALGLNQVTYQKFLALASVKSAKRSNFLFFGVFCLLTLICMFIGILMCELRDETLSKIINAEQFLPFVAKLFENCSGVLGFFAAMILSSSLSLFSSALNAIAATVLEDIYPFFFTGTLSEYQSITLLKVTILIFGTICTFLKYTIKDVNSALQYSNNCLFILGGSSTSLFLMATFFPWINSKGALLGCFSSLFVISWLTFNQNNDQLLLTNFFSNSSLTSTNNTYFEVNYVLHHFSHMWCTVLGAFASIIVGLLYNFFNSSDRLDVDPKLLTPLIRNIVKTKKHSNEPTDNIIYAYDRRI